MPQLVMNKILEKLDLPSILTLRNVCHDFRNFIDSIHLDCDLTRLEISLGPDKIYITYNTPYKQWVVSYTNLYSKGCLVAREEIRNRSVKRFKDNNFIEMFSKDFEIILNIFGTKLNLNRFELRKKYAYEEDGKRVLERLETILKTYKLKVKDETIVVTSFLSCLHSESSQQ
ncbi:hypothetical protein GCK72_019633 [Caenorhabditis remanei]|uniref:F-box domain-containing protein n=1 Tax=Caenorhabditis remanei TaxID=31234 RepID=A0A6A5GCU6_CAERE|nr:hypothetical protein GCK72_019633 [Caenorhabditis remanei]KAF1753077.1 hypothetical protein GCK72_019633 [Caenorhabditis remanei]